MEHRPGTITTQAQGTPFRRKALTAALLAIVLVATAADFLGSPVLAQTPPDATVLMSGLDDVVERDDDGSFTARPVFNRRVPLLHYGVRDADTGRWVSSVYQVRGGERRHRDGWEYTFEYPVLSEQPELDPQEPYVLAMITRQAVGADVYTFHAVIPVHQSDALWDRVLGALSPDRWARSVARWIIEGVHGALCGVVERATGVNVAECR